MGGRGIAWKKILSHCSVDGDSQRVLVVYYYNLANGPRHVAGTILEIE
ncbi:MAG: hypothetical protein ACREH8_05655 [Opitutaceae bacterium]